MAPTEVWPLGRYKLTQRAYIARSPGAMDEPLEIGTDIFYAGRPGPHMDPLDEAAEQAVSRVTGTGRDLSRLDPTKELSLVGGEPGSVPPPAPVNAPDLGGSEPLVNELPVPDGVLPPPAPTDIVIPAPAPPPPDLKPKTK